MAVQIARILVDTYSTEGPDKLLAAAARISLDRKIHVLVAGPGAALRERLSASSYDPMYLQAIDCEVPWGRRTGDALSTSQATVEALPRMLALLRDGAADALVSAGPAPQVRKVCTDGLARIAEGLPVAEAAVFPTMKRRNTDDPLALLVDVSGERSTGPHDLVAHALMGAAYARVVTGVRQPQLALLCSSLEPTSGPPDVVQAHQLLRQANSFVFTGNVRSTDLPKGLADVVVTDGFSGHAVRGLLEAVTEITVEAARYAWRKKVSWRVAMRLLNEGVGMLKRVSEFKQYGGAPLLGLQAPVILADPASDVQALSNAVKLAAKCARRDVVKEIEQAVSASTAWRSPERA